MLMLPPGLDAPGQPLLSDFHRIAARLPEGYRAGLLDGAIVITPPPDASHARWLSQVIRQLHRPGGEPADCSRNAGLIVPSRGPEGWGRVVPDLTIAPRAAGLLRDAPPWLAASGVTMSPRSARGSRAGRRRAYARAGIPRYLVASRELATVTLFTDPARGRYAGRVRVRLGELRPLPAPLPFALQAAGLAG